jgi:hypothetical protein
MLASCYAEETTNDFAKPERFYVRRRCLLSSRRSLFLSGAFQPYGILPIRPHLLRPPAPKFSNRSPSHA